MLSTEIWIVICLVLLILKYLIIEPSEDKKRYKMFESRDNIMLKAYKGEIEQKCEEYKYVVDTINFELYYMKNDYDFFIILNNLLRDPDQRRRKVDRIFKRIKRNEDLYNAFNVAYDTFIKQLNIRILVFNYLVILPIYIVLKVILWIINILENINNKVNWCAEVVINAYNKVKNGRSSCLDYLKENPYKLY